MRIRTFDDHRSSKEPPVATRHDAVSSIVPRSMSWTAILSEAAMDEDQFNMAVRKFLKVVGVTSQREIERVVRDHKVEGGELKLRMTLTAENVPLAHVVEETIKLG
jgi:flagellar biosynthesis regulator FlaF